MKGEDKYLRNTEIGRVVLQNAEVLPHLFQIIGAEKDDENGEMLRETGFFNALKGQKRETVFSEMGFDGIQDIRRPFDKKHVFHDD